MIPSMEPGLTENTLLGGRVRLLQPARGYRVAVDAVLLGASVEAVADARILDLGGVPMPMTPAEFGTFLAAETEKWAKVIRAANIKPN